MVAVVLALLSASPALSEGGDAERGAREFRTCLACHSLEPGEHLTGPSLAGVWGRKAGSLAGFHRYSEALKKSGIVWNESTLEAWLQDPQALVPGTFMAVRGVGDGRARANLIAFLRTTGSATPPRMSRPRLPDLKEAPKNVRVTTIRHCGDSYFVTTAAGETRAYWEFNLRFKTDSSASGPRPGEPVMVPAAMQGDRAQVVFANPAEISAFIKEKC